MARRFSTLAAGGGARPRRRRRDDDEMDITPMIDITFLLLIFFIVVSKMDQSTSVQLPLANYGTTVPAKDTVVITVTGDGGSGARIYLGDGLVNEVTDRDPEDQAQAVTAFVVDQLGKGKKFVIVKAEATVKSREVSRVLEAINAAKEDIPELSSMHVAVLQPSG